MRDTNLLAFLHVTNTPLKRAYLKVQKHPMLGRGGHLDAPHQARFERKLLSALTPSSLSRPISPNPSVTPTTPISPSPHMHPLAHLPSYLTDVYKRRCLSDTDLSHDWDESSMVYGTARGGPLPNVPPLSSHMGHHHHHFLMPRKGDSLESEASSTQVIQTNICKFCVPQSQVAIYFLCMHLIDSLNQCKHQGCQVQKN